ncbi:RNA polymerase III Rpc34 subunit, putative [Bodo saltans]|uniref:RNA polymerase III Rpc34 subunit, putative n=1 Tax=Bodo saltans TaxID=75058 RepID=A0A0S4JRE8_BODSA|nr:RNA polymerase III Rpc34 subunit, putative [Bodo saltans]|eukprot:CUG94078.1 RNA polymerase III Rpc34 subunit, putative [Bodo saltans]
MESVEKRVLARLAQGSQSFRDLQRDFHDVDSKILGETIRTLMESRRVAIHSVEGERYISAVNHLAEGLAVVYDLIRSSGCEGVDQTTICSRAKLPKTEVTKALNQLIAQQRIKDIRCFTNKAKKLYILFELEPSEAVTGGTFYNDARDIDVAFVDNMRSKIVGFIGSKKIASISQVEAFIEMQHLGKSVSFREIRQVVATLEMDGIVDVVCQPGESSDLLQLAQGKNVTRHAVPSTVGSSVSQFPCIGCPNLHRCEAHGVGAINPATCKYLDDWLRL